MPDKRGQPKLDIDIDALERDLKANVDGEVRFDTASRALYVSDASNYRQVPIGVVLPRSTDAVVMTVKVCQRYGAPVVSRGAGTSLVRPDLQRRSRDRPFEVSASGARDRPGAASSPACNPGSILDHLRDRAVSEHGLTFGPDPATHTRCTFGGMIGNNSCGIHSVMAGTTADNVHELDIVTYDGVRMKVGPTDDEALDRIVAAGGRRADIYLRLRNLRDRYGDIIRQRCPRIPRRVSGYALDELLPENGFNVARALVGSEGTCVTVLEANLKLMPQRTAQQPARARLPGCVQCRRPCIRYLAARPDRVRRHRRPARWLHEKKGP